MCSPGIPEGKEARREGTKGRGARPQVERKEGKGRKRERAQQLARKGPHAGWCEGTRLLRTDRAPVPPQGRARPGPLSPLTVTGRFPPSPFPPHLHSPLTFSGRPPRPPFPSPFPADLRSPFSADPRSLSSPFPADFPPLPSQFPANSRCPLTVPGRSPLSPHRSPLSPRARAGPLPGGSWAGVGDRDTANSSKAAPKSGTNNIVFKNPTK